MEARSIERNSGAMVAPERKYKEVAALLAGLSLGLLLMGTRVCAAEMAGHEAGAHPDAHAEHQHAHQHQAVPNKFIRSVATYSVPDVSMTRADRMIVRLAKELNDGRPVVLNFIYTTCTAVCPMTSQIFAAFQSRLGDDAAKVHMVSVSIDPEEDTPARLTEFRERYRAGPQWDFYTGTIDDSVKVQEAFASYYGDKMNHRPVTFMRAGSGDEWVRLEGFWSPDDLVKEYRALDTEK
jgi:protein SCO1/2